MMHTLNQNAANMHKAKVTNLPFNKHLRCHHNNIMELWNYQPQKLWCRQHTIQNEKVYKWTQNESRKFHQSRYPMNP